MSELRLSPRQTADFELLANGGFAPLEGFQGSEAWESVVERMRLPDARDDGAGDVDRSVFIADHAVVVGVHFGVVRAVVGGREVPEDAPFGARGVWWSGWG